MSLICGLTEQYVRDYVKEHGPITRAEFARRHGLDKNFHCELRRKKKHLISLFEKGTSAERRHEGLLCKCPRCGKEWTYAVDGDFVGEIDTFDRRRFCSVYCRDADENVATRDQEKVTGVIKPTFKTEHERGRVLRGKELEEAKRQVTPILSIKQKGDGKFLVPKGWYGEAV